MAIVINKSSNKVYEPASEGLHEAEIVSIKELQLQTQFGVKDTIQIIWITLDQKGTDGKYLSICQRFGKSLHEKSDLRRFLTSCGLRNLETLDLETLVNAKAQIVASHSYGKDGRIFVNVSTVIPSSFRLATKQSTAQPSDEEVF